VKAKKETERGVFQFMLIYILFSWGGGLFAGFELNK
jgi:hypothetical protein